MVIIQWIAKVSFILEDGIVVESAKKDSPFKDLRDEFGKFKDKKVFKDWNIFTKGELVQITIKDIDKKESYIEKTENSVKWNAIIYHVFNEVLYTKDIVKKEDRFKTLFDFQKGGLIMDDIYLNPDKYDVRFERGDIIEVEIRKI